MQYMAVPLEQCEQLLETPEQLPHCLERELRSLTPELMCPWTRSGQQQGIGRVSLGDLPASIRNTMSRMASKLPHRKR